MANLKKIFQNFIRRRVLGIITRRIAHGAQTYLKLWHNEGYYDFENNGEGRALQIFAKWMEQRKFTVWDVGAHIGEWAEEAHRYCPDADILSFEIVPSVFERFVKVADTRGTHMVYNFGLSDMPGIVKVMWSPNHDSTNSISPRIGSRFYNEDSRLIDVQVEAIDRLVFEKGVSPPTLLKIDTEGHEVSVLRGATKLFASHQAPAMIQFEYGDTFIPAGVSLHSVYELLTPHGYRIGRILPRSVDFKDYEYSDDHFRMGNYIAAREPSLIDLLARSGTD